MARGLSINNNYSRGPKKRTSIGNSPRSKPKNKSKRRLHTRSRGQGSA